MQLSYLHNNIIFSSHRYFCFALKINQSKEIWLFNCSEGCQFYCTQAKIKISQISKIIITELKVDNISGLIGLLSSLSLINRKKEIYIYGPIGINKYLSLVKKYSKTNFKYNLYIFTLTTGKVININTSYIYTFMSFIKQKSYDCLIMNDEKQIEFNLNKAETFQILSGPLYGELKKCYHFILPDGFILNGNKFTIINKIGEKIVLLSIPYHTRQLKQISKKVYFCYCI